MDAYGLFCERDAEDALARYEAAFANEGVDTLADAARERYELRTVSTTDATTGEAA